MSEKLKQQIAVMTTNLGCLMVFGALAMHFGKWWLILFSMLFWTHIQRPEREELSDNEEK